MTLARHDRAARRYSWDIRLAGSGILVAIIGLLAGLAAKRSADIASDVASQPTRMLYDPSNPIAPTFDPSSAHYTPPDYTWFWLGMAAVALGLLAIVAGALVALLRRASPASEAQ